MTTMTEDDFDTLVAGVGDGSGYGICRYASVQRVKDWSVFERYLKAAARSGIRYDKISHNCLHFAKETMAEMCKQWAKDHPGEPPAAWGIIDGDVPTDGDNRGDGWHALIFCETEEGLYLGGAQDRQVMNQSRVGEIKSVVYMIVGG